jgi:integrase
LPTLETKNGLYRTRVFFEGTQHLISLKTKRKGEADGALKVIEAGLWKLKTGQATLPKGVTLGEWLLSGGRITKASENHSLRELIDSYQKNLPEGTKSAATLQGEAIHFTHLIRILGERIPLKNLTQETLQRYVQKRSRQKFRDKTISGETIRKELRTLSVLITHGKSLGWIEQDNFPTRGLNFPRSMERPIFRTHSETMELVEGLNEEEAEPFWEAVYLDEKELTEFLKYCEDKSPTPWFFPIVVTCTFTGCRRSEFLRAQKTDFDFRREQFSIRERKRKHNVSESTRLVKIHPKLATTLKEWFKVHPGGRSAFCERENEPLTVNQVYHAWRNTLDESKWEDLRGFHCLRHSFISALARKGVDQRTIDTFVGHTSEEQRRRYRHLHPSSASDAINQLDFG